jgi:hypothetical protein
MDPDPTPVNIALTEGNLTVLYARLSAIESRTLSGLNVPEDLADRLLLLEGIKVLESELVLL